MNAFPLAPFLASLDGDGLRPTLHDYERISMVLSTSGPWTLYRLRSVLVALLARDEEQQELLIRRFNNFFQIDLDAERIFAEVDVQRALKDLSELAQKDTKSSSGTVEKTEDNDRFLDWNSSGFTGRFNNLAVMA
jgi:hypothetical protein